jgi:hypothetical protein
MRVTARAWYPRLTVYGVGPGTPWVAFHLRPTWRTGRWTAAGVIRVYGLGFLWVSVLAPRGDS